MTRANADAPFTLREALRGIWLADKYPIHSNEDWRVAAILDAEALEKAASAVASPDDPPEFAKWIAALRDPQPLSDERDQIMFALHDLFSSESQLASIAGRE